MHHGQSYTSSSPERHLHRGQAHLEASGGGGGGGKASKPAVPAKGGKGAAANGGALDEEGALRAIQVVLSGKPDQAAAEAQLRVAVLKVDPKPEGSAKGAALKPVRAHTGQGQA